MLRGLRALLTQDRRVDQLAAQDPEVRGALDVLRDVRAQIDGRQGYVYCISDGTAVKIGYSVNPKGRLADLQTGNPRKLLLLAQIAGTYERESALHRKYAAYNLLLEWFAPTNNLLREFGLTSSLYRKAHL